MYIIIYIYIFVCVYIYMCIYIYICVYVYVWAIPICCWMLLTTSPGWTSPTNRAPLFVPVASPPPSFCSNVKCRDLGRGREPTALELGRGAKPVFFFHGFCSKLVGHWSVNRLIRYGLIEYIWILLNIHPPEMTAPLGDHSTNIEWLLVISNKWHQISIFQPSWVDYTSRSSRSIFRSLFK